MARHPGLFVYFYCASNHVVQVYPSLALRVRGADACAIKALVMVAEFKFITGVTFFCGVASKVAIYYGTSIYSAFSAYLWRRVTLAGSYAQAPI